MELNVGVKNYPGKSRKKLRVGVRTLGVVEFMYCVLCRASGCTMARRRPEVFNVFKDICQSVVPEEALHRRPHQHTIPMRHVPCILLAAIRFEVSPEGDAPHHRVIAHRRPTLYVSFVTSCPFYQLHSLEMFSVSYATFAVAMPIYTLK